ncbi:LysR family transcriptional regulator [Pseudomonas sp. M30-35]|uniref:LysR family transcriptional regulator n=1 Tax=Pseudomonas sp. M30-35 TaxID=1981174 RepID=UPI000B3C8BFA|nr:LysR substrate-binding domain-containing protein [Pseudomonas sp. M30-35]ARU88933.1 LysR family transcriptional regulator [Pseudomonas sp. M30-35]
MHLRHIEVFQAILQTGSVTAAADLLNISQPAASKALKHAELQLGFRLFNRVRGKLEPTVEARILRNKTESLSADLQSLRRLASNLKQGAENTLRLVSTPALAQQLLPMALSQWRKKHPGVSCELATQHSAEMIQRLLLREADIGLTLQLVEHPGLQCELLAQGCMQLIASAGCWSKKQCDEPVYLQDLAGAPLIGLDTRDALGGLIGEHLRALQPAPKINTWVQTYQLAGALVMAGQGMALVDPLTARVAAMGGAQIRVLEPNLVVGLYLLRRVGEDYPRIQQLLIKQVGEVADRLMNEKI